MQYLANKKPKTEVKMLAESVLLGSFIILILLGVPISFGLGISSLLSAFAAGLQPAIIAQRVAAGMSIVSPSCDSSFYPGRSIDGQRRSSQANGGFGLCNRRPFAWWSCHSQLYRFDVFRWSFWIGSGRCILNRTNDNTDDGGKRL